ncbi:unnamed protein product, partial [Prorocentrum cordatum]
ARAERARAVAPLCGTPLEQPRHPVSGARRGGQKEPKQAESVRDDEEDIVATLTSRLRAPGVPALSMAELDCAAAAFDSEACFEVGGTGDLRMGEVIAKSGGCRGDRSVEDGVCSDVEAGIWVVGPDALAAIPACPTLVNSLVVKFAEGPGFLGDVHEYERGVMKELDDEGPLLDWGGKLEHEEALHVFGVDGEEEQRDRSDSCGQGGDGEGVDNAAAPPHETMVNAFDVDERDTMQVVVHSWPRKGCDGIATTMYVVKVGSVDAASRTADRDLRRPGWQADGEEPAPRALGRGGCGWPPMATLQLWPRLSMGQVGEPSAAAPE